MWMCLCSLALFCICEFALCVYLFTRQLTGQWFLTAQQNIHVHTARWHTPRQTMFLRSHIFSSPKGGRKAFHEKPMLLLTYLLYLCIEFWVLVKQRKLSVSKFNINLNVPMSSLFFAQYLLDTVCCWLASYSGNFYIFDRPYLLFAFWDFICFKNS